MRQDWPNWGRLYAEWRCKAVWVPWTAEEALERANWVSAEEIRNRKVLETKDEVSKPITTWDKSLAEQYEEKFGTKVPNNKKNDLEWIQSKLSN